IQNELSRSLILQDFLPRSGTNRYFRRTLRNKGFFGASASTADHSARSSWLRSLVRTIDDCTRLCGEVVERLLQLRLSHLRLFPARPRRFLFGLAFLDKLGPRPTLAGHGFISLGMLLHRKRSTISGSHVVFVFDRRTFL